MGITDTVPQEETEDGDLKAALELVPQRDLRSLIEKLEDVFQPNYFYVVPTKYKDKLSGEWKTKKVYGLSVAGADWVQRVLGGITIKSVQTERIKDRTDPKYDMIVTTVEVHDKIRDITTPGVGTAYVYEQWKDNARDRHAEKKAISQARRNAIKQLIPKDLLIKSAQLWHKKIKAGDWEENMDEFGFYFKEGERAANSD